MGKAGMIAVGALANLLAGLGLIEADELSGMAHLSEGQMAALRAGRTAPGIPEPSATVSPTADLAPVAPFVSHSPGMSGAPHPDETDRRFVIKRILPITGPIKYGEWHWDEAGVPAGPLVITVELQARVLSAFRNGYEIGTTAVLLGTQEKPTPLGVFPITQKDAHHVSNLYDAAMPYMLRLTDDGVTIHATKVENGYASHGCIGVPIGFAKQLFSHAHIGDRVYITRGKQVGLGDSLVDQ